MKKTTLKVQYRFPKTPTFTRANRRIARDHKFKTTTRADNKIKDLSFKAKTPLGDKNKNVVYNIPCGCGKYSYTGETDRKWRTRKKEHMEKVRLTHDDITNGNMERATERMNTGDGGLAKHSVSCDQQINCDHGARDENHTEKISGRNNDSEGKGERSGTPKFLQPN